MKIVSIIIDCQDCSWRTEDYKNGLKKARKHHASTGHAMSGSIGYALHWDRK